MHNKYRRRMGDENPVFSEIYGIPLINTAKLLACVASDLADEGCSAAVYQKDPRYQSILLDVFSSFLFPDEFVDLGSSSLMRTTRS